MINIDDEFKNYVSLYNMNDKKIRLKYNHSYRVKNIAVDIAKSLNLSDDDIYLASTIGLLHDIGRFEQVRIYNTFDDRVSIDHAALGVKILFEDNMIRKFADNQIYDFTINKAISNHNKLFVEANLDDNTILHSKIIRDADKLDILYIKGYLDELDIKDDCSKVTNEVENEFFNNMQINRKYIKSTSDKIISYIAFIYDFNFPYSYKYILDNKILEAYYNKLKNKEYYKKYFEHAFSYIKDKVDEYEQKERRNKKC